MTPKPHEFITVATRRWCLGCYLYQQYNRQADRWLPHCDPRCPRATPYARACDNPACRYPNCDGGPATGYCHEGCKT